jgi:hypothetical protein
MDKPNRHIFIKEKFQKVYHIFSGSGDMDKVPVFRAGLFVANRYVHI